MWFYMLQGSCLLKVAKRNERGNYVNYKNGTFSCVFYRDSESENTIFKTCDKGNSKGGQNTKHGKQNLQKSLMGPSGWQKKKQFKDKS